MSNIIIKISKISLVFIMIAFCFIVTIIKFDLLDIKYLKHAKTLAPSILSNKTFLVKNNIFIDNNFTEEESALLLKLVPSSQKVVSNYFNYLKSNPNIIFCKTQECFRSFGGGGNRGFSVGHSSVVLAPSDLSLLKCVLTHELFHAELAKQVGLIKIYDIPSWFNEGMAVLVSNDLRYSIESLNHELQRLNLEKPNIKNMISLSDFSKIAGKSHIIAYGTAYEFVNSWFNQVGTSWYTRI